MKDLEKMLMSKQGKSAMTDQEKQAKMDVLMELLDMATHAMGSKVKGGMDEMKKVSVMAPDQEGLAKGLDMAKEIAASKDEPTTEEGSHEEEESESPIEKLAEMKAEESSSSPISEALKAASPAEDDEEDSIFNRKKTKVPTKKNFLSED